MESVECVECVECVDFVDFVDCVALVVIFISSIFDRSERLIVLIDPNDVIARKCLGSLNLFFV